MNLTNHIWHFQSVTDLNHILTGNQALLWSSKVPKQSFEFYLRNTFKVPNMVCKIHCESDFIRILFNTMRYSV